MFKSANFLKIADLYLQWMSSVACELFPIGNINCAILNNGLYASLPFYLVFWEVKLKEWEGKQLFRSRCFSICLGISRLYFKDSLGYQKLVCWKNGWRQIAKCHFSSLKWTSKVHIFSTPKHVLMKSWDTATLPLPSLRHVEFECFYLELWSSYSLWWVNNILRLETQLLTNKLPSISILLPEELLCDSGRKEMCCLFIYLFVYHYWCSINI